jgi:hypothetical protein
VPSDECARSLLERAVEAMGGAALIDGLKSVRLVTRSTRWLAQGPSELSSTTWIAFPDRYRQELRLPFGSVTTVFTPAGAFVVGAERAAALPEAERVGMEDAIYRNLLAFLRTRHHVHVVVRWDGEDVVGGRTVDRIRVDVYGRSTRIAFDRATGLPSELRYPARALEGSPEVLLSFDDFRTVNGLRYPFRTTGWQAGRKAFEGLVETLALNEDLPESLFTVPALVPVEKP